MARKSSNESSPRKGRGWDRLHIRRLSAAAGLDSDRQDTLLKWIESKREEFAFWRAQPQLDSASIRKELISISKAAARLHDLLERRIDMPGFGNMPAPREVTARIKAVGIIGPGDLSYLTQSLPKLVEAATAATSLPGIPGTPGARELDACLHPVMWLAKQMGLSMSGHDPLFRACVEAVADAEISEDAINDRLEVLRPRLPPFLQE